MPRGSEVWMWVEACERLGQADRLHRTFFRLAAAEHAPAVWEPPVDVFESESEIVVAVAMPGVASDRVQVAWDAGALVVRGNRPLAMGAYRIRHLELPHGAFERRIPLPPLRFEIGAPELTHGLLVVRLQKLGRPA